MEYRGIDPLKHLIEQVEQINKEIVDIKTRLELKTYTLREIAEGQGLSINTMRSKPWKQPNFGKPDVNSCPAKWYYSTIVAWFSRPEDERRLEWQSMTGRKRRQAMGKTA